MKRIPHVYAILFALMVLAGILTHVVTPGEFERETVDGRDGFGNRSCPVCFCGDGNVFHPVFA
ncbi:hypothetical protein [Desmospora profundinema]|uniref:Ion transporter superfamily protein YfcC n=1 Tax=Desmospora profundinema TaxID=1571184 RepID=A0ABU1IRW6_9BACL|nr:hypothetical protein [Desmospora profundinema]MDR6226664.1 putative ion transporter superfamily protein YfcC [Desmospora profundinema]